jgi:hypothetical protein
MILPFFVDSIPYSVQNRTRSDASSLGGLWFPLQLKHEAPNV